MDEEASARARYLVVAAYGDTTTTAAENAAPEEALTVAREVRARGQRVWIMRTDGERAQCASRDLDERMRHVAGMCAIDPRLRG